MGISKVLSPGHFCLNCLTSPPSYRSSQLHHPLHLSDLLSNSPASGNEHFIFPVISNWSLLLPPSFPHLICLSSRNVDSFWEYVFPYPLSPAYSLCHHTSFYYNSYTCFINKPAKTNVSIFMHVFWTSGSIGFKHFEGFFDLAIKIIQFSLVGMDSVFGSVGPNSSHLMSPHDDGNLDRKERHT